MAIHRPRRSSLSASIAIFLERNFDSCVLAGRVSNRYGIVNSAVGWDEIFVCRRLR